MCIRDSYKHDDVVAKIKKFAQVAKAISYSKSLKVASFGNNMRHVAVTEDVYKSQTLTSISFRRSPKALASS